MCIYVCIYVWVLVWVQVSRWMEVRGFRWPSSCRHGEMMRRTLLHSLPWLHIADSGPTGMGGFLKFLGLHWLHSEVHCFGEVSPTYSSCLHTWFQGGSLSRRLSTCHYCLWFMEVLPCSYSWQIGATQIYCRLMGEDPYFFLEETAEGVTGMWSSWAIWVGYSFCIYPPGSSYAGRKGGRSREGKSEC